MERMKTQVELLKECCDIKDAACVRYQKRIAELEEENRKLKEELAHYKNIEAIQKSNNASRYNPYKNKSYTDREFRKEYTEEEQELLDLDYGTGFTAKFVNH